MDRQSEKRAAQTGGPTPSGWLPPEQLAGAPRVWAVGGGKGGVGKSVVASNLAAAVAGMGRRCVIVDADLGGANLHTLLGVSRPRRTLSHFLSGEVGSLADLMVQTPVPNLWLVSGNQALLDMANPKHCQKEKLLRHVRGLDVDEVLLDLGAGSTFNVLDFFLAARRGLVVVTPEPTAIENAEYFLRAAFYRSLRAAARRPEVRAAILRVREHRRNRPVHSAWELIALVRQIDPPAAKPLQECAQAFAPVLLVNQAETAEHRRAGRELAARCRERMGVAIELAGCLAKERNVPEAVARRQPAYQLFSRCSFSRSIEALAQRLLRDDDEPLDGGEGWEDADSGDRFGEALAGERVDGVPDSASTGRRLPTLDLGEPGAYLRRCREHLGQSLDQMTERTRIRGLDDIESERFELLPPEPYLKGFLLQYARELGIGELEALADSYLHRYRIEERRRP